MITKMWKINFRSNRKYHVYKFASHTLSILEFDLKNKKTMIKDIIEKTSQSKKSQTFNLFKEIKKSKPLQDIQQTQNVLNAASNIIRLCNQSYEICKEVEETGNVPVLDEELISFIELTNEMYPCIQKDLYDKIIHA